MPNNKAGFYFDEHGTRSMLDEITEEDQLLTETINSSKTIGELKKQNELYEKEIKEIHRNGTITKWTVIISAVATIISAIISVVLRCPS